MVSSKKLLRLLEVTKSYVVFNKENLDVIENLFLQVIDKNKSKAKEYLNSLKIVKNMLSYDLEFFMESDPAVDSKEEIVLAYPGYKAIMTYRIAHILYSMNYKLQARMMSESAHSQTGIDIHPGANLASPLFIDHGTGIVIGETTISKKNLKIYQGVTLGALSLKNGASLKGTKRHPTLGENVIIYAGASILGDIAVGDNVTIGSNVFITESIPDNVKVTFGKPALVISKK